MYKLNQTSGACPEQYPQKKRDPNDSSWTRQPCMDPCHDPPTLLYIPAGQSKTHRCPSCGQETVMRNNIIHWC